MTAHLDQQRAEFVWNIIDADSAAVSPEAAQRCKAAPALVAGSGLMAALAFWTERVVKDKSYHLLVVTVCEWLKYRGLLEFATGPANQVGKESLKQLARLSPGDYRRAMTETMSVLRWLRQFATVAVDRGAA